VLARVGRGERKIASLSSIPVPVAGVEEEWEGADPLEAVYYERKLPFMQVAFAGQGKL
jgi:hypothetical protein